jgi:uncharacterized protein (DUF433 family)
MASVELSHIEKKPGVCGGKACVAGTRIRVQDIYVWHELQGQSPDEIVSRFPQLSLADVHAALAYYWDNRGEIQQERTRAESLLAQMRQSTPSPLEEKLRGTDAAKSQVPSR